MNTYFHFNSVRMNDSRLEVEARTVLVSLLNSLLKVGLIAGVRISVNIGEI